jgi:phycocyanobilin:ferredoxin oxidoreductase
MNLHPVIQDLANRIQAIWREQLILSPYPMPEDLGYVEGKLEGERVEIQNFCFQAPQFRKLHLELAKVGNNLDILHCVMFPNSKYALPIFGADLVGNGRAISAAIADLSPVVPFSNQFTQALDQWQDLRNSFTQPRELPTWGDIFSPYCVFVRLENLPDASSDNATANNAEEKSSELKQLEPKQLEQKLSESDRFLELVINYIQLNCQIANQLADSNQLAEIAEEKEILAGQRNYCEQQRRNDKTKRILEKAFGTEWAERYMTTVLFDVL